MYAACTFTADIETLLLLVSVATKVTVVYFD